MQKSYIPATLLACMAVAVIGGLGYAVNSSAQNADAHGHGTSEKVTRAVAVVHPLSDSEVKGIVTFTQKSDGVEIVAELTGLTPGDHGFHVHEFGDCSKMDGSCAGSHFNPTGARHGGPDDEDRHAGDFGNVTADESGKATYKRVDKMIKLNGPQSIIGRAIIIHADPDDLTSQPTGNAGGRVGCGVIGIADPNMDMEH